MALGGSVELQWEGFGDSGWRRKKTQWDRRSSDRVGHPTWAKKRASKCQASQLFGISRSQRREQKKGGLEKRGTKKGRATAAKARRRDRTRGGLLGSPKRRRFADARRRMDAPGREERDQGG